MADKKKRFHLGLGGFSENFREKAVEGGGSLIYREFLGGKYPGFVDRWNPKCGSVSIRSGELGRNSVETLVPRVPAL